MNLCGKVLVTGGAGFIGSHLVDKLASIECVEEVKVLDNFSTGKIENLKTHLGKPKLSIIKGDVRSQETVRKVMKEINYVFHEAAIASVPLSVKDPLTTHNVNVIGTLNLLEEARVNDSIFIYASSCAVYGDPKRIPISEEDPPKPISPYGASKLSAESYCIAYNKTYGLKTVCLRYFNVYGPRQSYSQYAGVITIFIHKAMKKEPLTIYGDGKQTRDFIYVEDVVNANLVAATCNKAYGEVINVGTGKETSINELALKIGRIFGFEKPRMIYEKARSGDIRRSLADVTRMKRILGYVSKFDVDEGLPRVIKWVRKENQ